MVIILHGYREHFLMVPECLLLHIHVITYKFIRHTCINTFHRISLTPLCSKISVALSFHNPIKATKALSLTFLLLSAWPHKIM
jgi:hypothetical protein